MEELQTLFRLFDTDGNGTIDIQEVAALFRKLGFEPSTEKLTKLVMQVDGNKNGELEFAEFCEFLKLAKKQGGLGLGESMSNQFTELTNENGTINNDDLGNFLRTCATHPCAHAAQVQGSGLRAQGSGLRAQVQARRVQPSPPSPLLTWRSRPGAGLRRRRARLSPRRRSWTSSPSQMRTRTAQPSRQTSPTS